MEEKCKNCSSKAEYICVCVERHLCDNCLLNHVSKSSDLSHRPVSLAHPLLTLLMESEPHHQHKSSSSIQDQIMKLAAFKNKSINMIEKKIKQLLDQNEKNSLKKSANKTRDTYSIYKASSEINSRMSPVIDGKSIHENRSQFTKSPMLCREDLSPEPYTKLSARSFIENHEIHYKIIITGDLRVGKTTLLTTFKGLNKGLSLTNSEKVNGIIRSDGNEFHIDL